MANRTYIVQSCKRWACYCEYMTWNFRDAFTKYKLLLTPTGMYTPAPEWTKRILVKENEP